MQEVRRTARTGRPVGVIMLDVDTFQRFNDPCGPGGRDRVAGAPAI